MEKVLFNLALFHLTKFCMKHKISQGTGSLRYDGRFKYSFRDKDNNVLVSVQFDKSYIPTYIVPRQNPDEPPRFIADGRAYFREVADKKIIFDETTHCEEWQNELAKELNIAVAHAKTCAEDIGTLILSLVNRIVNFEDIRTADGHYKYCVLGWRASEGVISIVQVFQDGTEQAF